MMQKYESVLDALLDLQSKGYKQVFRRGKSTVYCLELNLWLTPGQFSVDEYYHFEQMYIPDAGRVVFAITSVVTAAEFLPEISKLLFARSELCHTIPLMI